MKPLAYIVIAGYFLACTACASMPGQEVPRRGSTQIFEFGRNPKCPYTEEGTVRLRVGESIYRVIRARNADAVINYMWVREDETLRGEGILIKYTEPDCRQ